MIFNLQESVVTDYKNHYHFYSFVNEVITRLMVRECDNYEKEVKNIYKKSVDLTILKNVSCAIKYRTPKKLPIFSRLKHTPCKGLYNIKSPLIDLVLKLKINGVNKSLSLSKITKNKKKYSIDFLLENSMFTVKPEYHDILVLHIEQINALNELSLFVRQIVVELNYATSVFFPSDSAIDIPPSKTSKIQKLFKLNRVAVFEYLTGEIFMHQKYYAEELFEIIRSIKNNFEVETKQLINEENKHLKQKSESSKGQKYYPVLNPIRITLQKGPMFIIKLPSADGHLNNMFTSIRIKSSQKIKFSIDDFSDRDLFNKAKRDVYATHNLTKIDLPDGAKGLIPEMVLYNRFRDVPFCLFPCVKEMMARLDFVNSLKSVVFKQQDDLAVLSNQLVNSKTYKSAAS